MKSKMVIEYVDIQTIKSYSKNAKIHSKSQIEKIAKSIEKFGWKQNLVIDKGGVLVAGHGRYEAAKLLGLKEVPCVRADDLTEDEIRAYRLIDNEIAKSDTDWEIFNEELDKIEDVDIDDFDLDIPETFSVDDIQDFGGVVLRAGFDISAIDGNEKRAIYVDETGIAHVERIGGGERFVTNAAFVDGDFVNIDKRQDDGTCW